MPSLKPFPLVGFADVLELIEAILRHGVNGEIRRLRLFKAIDRSPGSGPSRQLISTASKYGLVNGSAGSEMLSVTDDGRYILTHPNTAEGARKKFELSVGNFTAFHALYEKIKNQRIPEMDVLEDELMRLGIPSEDSAHAADIFIANLEYNNLITTISGSPTVITLEHFLEENVPTSQQEDNEESTQHPAEDPLINHAPEMPQGMRSQSSPSLHIDVQIHIDSSASSEQIEQIFASMAKHLYGREND